MSALAVALIASLMMSMLVQEPTLDGITMLARLGVALLLTVSVATLVGARPERLKHGLVAWTLGACVVVLVGFVAWLLAVLGVVRIESLVYASRSGYRIESLLPDPNRFGTFAAILMVAATTMQLWKSKLSGAWSAAALTGAVGVVASMSRGAMLAAAVGLCTSVLVAMVLQRGRIRVRVLRTLLALAVLGALGATLMIKTLPDGAITQRVRLGVWRVTSMLEDQRTDHYRSVVDGMSTGTSSLIFGIGNFGVVDLGTEEVSSHSTYLTVLGGQGLLGFTLFVTCITLVMVLTVLQIRSSDPAMAGVRASLIGGLVVVLAHGVTVNLYTTGFAWIWMGLAGASLGIRNPLSNKPTRSW